MYRQPGSSRSGLPALVGMTEFDILKAKHKFLRDEDEAAAVSDKTSGKANDTASWEDRLAQKYYASLYREFAVCDLKHYKSGNFALRWRTEDEVISGAGEETCGNTRCPLHEGTSNGSSSSTPSSGLKTVEVPFAYEEHGQYKSALVKVVLCEKCLKKLMWKHEREKEERREMKREEVEVEEEVKVEEDEGEVKVKLEEGGDDERVKMKLSMEEEHERRRGHERRRERSEEGSTRRRRKSRSLSPHSHRRRREHKDKHRRHEHSPLK